MRFQRLEHEFCVYYDDSDLVWIGDEGRKSQSRVQGGRDGATLRRHR